MKFYFLTGGFVVRDGTSSCILTESSGVFETFRGMASMLGDRGNLPPHLEALNLEWRGG
jgi:hypothetical protein